MEEIKVTFGKNLRTIRRDRELSQEQLAYSARIDRSYIGQVERGKIHRTIEKLYVLADTLNRSHKDLILELLKSYCD